MKFKFKADYKDAIHAQGSASQLVEYLKLGSDKDGRFVIQNWDGVDFAVVLPESVVNDSANWQEELFSADASFVDLTVDGVESVSEAKAKFHEVFSKRASGDTYFMPGPLKFRVTMESEQVDNESNWSEV